MGRLILVSAVALLLFGLVMAYSASTYQGFYSYGSSWYFLKKQLLFAGIGLIVMYVLSRVDYRLLRKMAMPAALAVMGLLVLVAVPGIGSTINGARRWIDIFGTSLQPSELAKPATVLLLAALLAAKPSSLKTFKGFAIVTGVVFVPMAALILVGKDLSTTAVLAMTVSAILIVAGVRWGHLLTAGAAVAGVAAILIFSAPWRAARFTAFLDPWAHADTSGFQATQSLIAVGSGRVFGVGLGNSVQKSGFLPEQTTDMITGVIGEELGLIGILLLVLLYGLLAWAGFRLALTCREPFARYVCAGLTVAVVGQALLNLGAAMGMLPIMGVPLPLVSCGGTSLLAVLAGVGIMLNIASNRRSHIVASPERRRRTGGGRGDRRPHGAGAGGR
jgi:cell division protein FtsW